MREKCHGQQSIFSRKQGATLYDEHAGIFLMYGVQVEVKFSVFNEVAYRQVLGCPEVYDKLSAMTKGLKEVFDDQRAQTSD